MPREPLGIVPSQTLFLARYTFPLEILTTTPLGRPILLPIVQMQKLKPEQLSQLSKATQLVSQEGEDSDPDLLTAEWTVPSIETTCRFS